LDVLIAATVRLLAVVFLLQSVLKTYLNKSHLLSGVKIAGWRRITGNAALGNTSSEADFS